MCGGHFHRLSVHTRGKLKQASVRLERREQAIARYGWTLRRQDRVDESVAELTEWQRIAIEEVDRVERGAPVPA